MQKALSTVRNILGNLVLSHTSITMMDLQFPIEDTLLADGSSCTETETHLHP
jgi:hypothetical protein